MERERRSWVSWDSFPRTHRQWFGGETRGQLCWCLIPWASQPCCSAGLPGTNSLRQHNSKCNIFETEITYSLSPCLFPYNHRLSSAERNGIVSKSTPYKTQDWLPQSITFIPSDIRISHLKRDQWRVGTAPLSHTIPPGCGILVAASWMCSNIWFPEADVLSCDYHTDIL